MDNGSKESTYILVDNTTYILDISDMEKDIGRNMPPYGAAAALDMADF